MEILSVSVPSPPTIPLFVLSSSNEAAVQLILRKLTFRLEKISIIGPRQFARSVEGSNCGEKFVANRGKMEGRIAFVKRFMKKSRALHKTRQYLERD